MDVQNYSDSYTTWQTLAPAGGYPDRAGIDSRASSTPEPVRCLPEFGGTPYTAAHVAVYDGRYCGEHGTFHTLPAKL